MSLGFREPVAFKTGHRKKLSRKYVEHIRNQMDYLNSIDLPKEVRDHELNVCQEMLALWSICEIIFITGSPSDLVIEDFLEWVNLIDPGTVFSMSFFEHFIFVIFILILTPLFFQRK